MMHGQANSIQDFYVFVSNTLFYFFFVFRNECIASEVEKLRKSAVKGHVSVVSVTFILCS